MLKFLTLLLVAIAVGPPSGLLSSPAFLYCPFPGQFRQTSEVSFLRLLKKRSVYNYPFVHAVVGKSSKVSDRTVPMQTDASLGSTLRWLHEDLVMPVQSDTCVIPNLMAEAPSAFYRLRQRARR